MNDPNRTVLDQLREQYPELSASHRTIAQFVISHTAHSAFLPITRLAEMTGVSTATIVRFAQLLGYSGYPEFQAAIQGLLLNQIDSNQHLEDLRNQMNSVLSGEQPVDHHQLMRTVLIAQAEHLTRLADGISKEEFEQAIASIVAARAIYVVGMRLSSAIATALWHGLHLLRPDVHLANASSGFLPDHLSECGEGDVLVGITYRRYMVDTIHSMKFARQRGAKVIAITDSRLSPAAVIADLALVTPVIMQLSHIPLAPSLALVSAILECVAATYREQGMVGRPRKLADDTQIFQLFTRTNDE